MKKVFCVSLLALMLVCLLCASALAQTTGIAMDGKVYTFTGGEGTYQADGKTFIIGAESVVVQESGSRTARWSLLGRKTQQSCWMDGMGILPLPGRKRTIPQSSAKVQQHTRLRRPLRCIRNTPIRIQRMMKPGPGALSRMRNTD